MYLIGYDSGTSSIKATLMDAETGVVVASATSPKKEMEIIAKQAGWAEQDPQGWWDNVKLATAEMLAGTDIDTADIAAIGITYQMHGLVCVDKNKEVLRPSIIWCDSRAVPYGEKATAALGGKHCLEHLLNYPGNFTATKLAWVKENEPNLFDKIEKIMLPGDYLAMKMTGDICTTQSGLSEGILWDFKCKQVANFVMDHLGFSKDILPDIVPTFGDQGQLSKQAAAELGLKAGTKIAYRAGDQPNNAFSLNVLEPGEVAATAGTSGVVYGIGDKATYDPKSRVNTFVHVNNTDEAARYGALLCVGGTGILNSWLKHNTSGEMDYPEMNAMAGKAPIGANRLSILPYGNGAERTLENKDIGACLSGINFNTHDIGHVLRAAQEGIVFALNYGFEIIEGMGIEVNTVRAGDANMFLSDIFAGTFANVTGATVELYNTDGSQGAARGAGIGAGTYSSFKDAFVGFKKTKTIEPKAAEVEQTKQAYANWLEVLNKKL